MHTYMSLQEVCVSSREFLSVGFVWGYFVWKVLSGVVFVRSSFCQNTCTSVTTESRKLNITFNFRFHMYDFLKCDVTCSWTPSPCHKLSHLLGPLPPSVTHLIDCPITT